MSRTPIPWLRPAAGPGAFPDPRWAAADSPLAAGGALSPEWLIGAYRRGIFPWFSEGEPILWWSPDPRAVVLPEEFAPSRSLRQSLRNRGYETRLDTDFAAVVAACAAPRAAAAGTWITPAMQAAYARLHRLGHAHSVETWQAGVLVGGLYGVRVGALFCGESMFATARDASKVAFAALVRHALAAGIRLIDCQLPTPHLASLGARTLTRAEFLARLPALVGS